MDMASSASSRMRECGTATAEAATAGPILACGLDTLENRRCGDAEAGKDVRINEHLIGLKPLGSAGGVEDPNRALLRVCDPHGLCAVREIKNCLVLETRCRFR